MQAELGSVRMDLSAARDDAESTRLALREVEAACTTAEGRVKNLEQQLLEALADEAGRQEQASQLAHEAAVDAAQTRRHTEIELARARWADVDTLRSARTEFLAIGMKQTARTEGA